MTDTTIDNTLTFATLKPEPAAGTGYLGSPVTLINGHAWEMIWWDSPSLRHLRREVPAGEAQISEWRDGRFGLTHVHPKLQHAELRHSGRTYDTLAAAAAAGESFAWQTREHAGLTWYAIDPDARLWVAELSDADHAVVHQHDDGRYSMKRRLSPRAGETYEISASRRQSADADISVKTFAEAAAIALTLPTFVGMLGGAWPTNGRGHSDQEGGE
ncbi:hypothetical protein ABEG10_38275 (plasmid) [Burkholderia cenocepacia]|uniref:hypothetical protein n=3 Tax=Burkholderia cenocepacia TaxID=95486 RepID=UPI0020A18D19|nr:hypothetical protein [Burkholderia cenocepacia]MCO8402765.1 hypothetical protein [Burkholderia cenocepacia]MCO8415101.1 hypothetical protein [Burkholderia cenocepacia]MCO8423100.1 hypothetical protein [Burkholderia cenocepacia]MCO8474751.1 hypothetical protein [Burkholderia cenocepacia]MCO8482069.1 hypothetical protein [Burkholderia cenocepacia]